MYYGEIKTCDIANGPGVRVSLFVSGCRNHCKGCFNSETWSFDYGQPFTDEAITDIIGALDPYYITGFSLLGGDPFEPENQRSCTMLLEEIRNVYPSISIWCWTGYLYDTDLVRGGKCWTPWTEQMLSYIDTLVDGPFIEEEKEEIRSQVEEYRKFAPLIQTGLYYRLSDPSKEEYAAWAFVSEDQKEVLLNVVMQEIHGNMTVNYVNLQGLKCSAVYRDTETGKTYNGAALMEAGIPMPVEMGEFKAYQMHLVGEE